MQCRCLCWLPWWVGGLCALLSCVPSHPCVIVAEYMAVEYIQMLSVIVAEYIVAGYIVAEYIRMLSVIAA